ncbi:MAG TPA: NAD(P)/FAD-dependent oxidoreductase [Candidatus Paceibacterota bacterium]
MIYKKRILVLGGGYGGTYTFKHLHKSFKNNSGVELRLISKTNYFVSTPFLHEVATGNIDPEHVAEPLRKIFPGPEEFQLADVKAISLKDKKVETNEGVIAYDYLIMALGAETNYRNTPGAREHTLALKTLEDAIKLKNHFISTFDQAANLHNEEEIRKKLRFVVIGGGATGVELVSEMSDFLYSSLGTYYTKNFIAHISIILVHAGDDLLPNFSHNIRLASKKVLRKKKIEIKFGLQVIEVRPGALVLNNGEVIESDTIIWAAGVSPSSVSVTPSVERERGRIIVNQFFQIPSYPEVFVLGDQAAFRNVGDSAALPMLAQVAHKQADAVARNVARIVEGKLPMPYTYKHLGDLVSLGEWVAAGELFGIKIFGHVAWFFWRGVYLSKLLSPTKKVKVLLDWLLNLFAPRDISAIN